MTDLSQDHLHHPEPGANDARLEVLHGAGRLLETAALCSDAEASGDANDPRFSRSPTEVALLLAVHAMGTDLFSLHADFPRLRTGYRSEQNSKVLIRRTTLRVTSHRWWCRNIHHPGNFNSLLPLIFW